MYGMKIEGSDTVSYTHLDVYKRQYEYLVIDNEAGMEHLSRKTTKHIDKLLLVSDCSRRSVQAVARIRDLARELNLSVGDKMCIRDSIYYNQDVINSDRSNKSPYDTSQETREQIEAIKNKLMGLSVSCNCLLYTSDKALIDTWSINSIKNSFSNLYNYNTNILQNICKNLLLKNI